jgi:hypothetical protein
MAASAASPAFAADNRRDLGGCTRPNASGDTTVDVRFDAMT